MAATAGLLDEKAEVGAAGWANGDSVVDLLDEKAEPAAG
jgi:hypothetical protein